MTEPQYVQHQSGQGQKWRVTDNYQDYAAHSWRVPISGKDEANTQWHYLPKSEYVLVAAPEVWRDVTKGCNVPTFTSQIPKDHCEVWHGLKRLFVVSEGYRVRKVTVQQVGGVIVKGGSGDFADQLIIHDAFIVEQKEA